MLFLTFLLSDPIGIALLGALLFWGLFCFFTRPKESAGKWPPGPTPLPFIGNLHLLDLRRQDKSLMKISEEYGPVFTIHFGLQKMVVLTGYEAVREALVNFAEEFADRPPIPIFQCIQEGQGIFFSSGELWKTTRKFTMSSLHNLGMGKMLMVKKILEEFSFLAGLIDSFKGKPFKLKLFKMAPTNITFLLLFGDRFDYQDPTFVTLLRLIDEVMVLLGSPFLHLFNFYPFLGWLLKPHKTILVKIEEVRVILRNYMVASRQRIPGGYVTSYIAALMQKQSEEPKGETYFSDANIVASVLDLVMAGTETTSTSLQWAVLLMAKYPEVQAKVQDELDRVLGASRLPEYEDQKALPYTNAVLHEIQRFIALLPHVPHSTSVDTHFRGYFLPKGTPVIPLLTSVLLDQTQWETPNEFNPSHFLDADGNFVKKAAFLPFSIGRRVCVGESLAKMEMFLFFVTLLQRFTFHPPPGIQESDLDITPEATFMMRPQPQSVCAVPRS
ncbi:cytochrome P450 2W1-like isoform X1 [Vombatus ursinus]|uniref:Cytochrome P450 2W1 n=1 Tax=Vombatus ursinus TaxID=29139 RepID=A0A4X2LMY3_VOMUR|nr:cytochrome P450 2W1-like isoform X1 [Vombatus ursinus]XP_027730860.1 cytochrome P450 2W1-like isoform X1 [Vombatus ursinus]